MRFTILGRLKTSRRELGTCPAGFSSVSVVGETMFEHLAKQYAGGADAKDTLPECVAPRNHRLAPGNTQWLKGIRNVGPARNLRMRNHNGFSAINHMTPQFTLKVAHVKWKWKWTRVPLLP